MNKRIIFTNAEGGVSIIVPAPGITIEDCAKAVPTNTAYEIVDAADVPADRTFRNAWKQNGKRCEVDVVKAKDITHERRRAKRTTEFAPLDVEATIPTKAAQAETKRRAVRDRYDAMQAAIDAAATADELKAIIEAEGI